MSPSTHWPNVCRVTALVTLGALGGFGGAYGCASLRPKLEVAREDFVQACDALTEAVVGDATPSRAELIAERVCLAERVIEQIEREAVRGERDLVAPLPDAGAR